MYNVCDDDDDDDYNNVFLSPQGSPGVKGERGERVSILSNDIQEKLPYLDVLSLYEKLPLSCSK